MSDDQELQELRTTKAVTFDEVDLEQSRPDSPEQAGRQWLRRGTFVSTDSRTTDSRTFHHAYIIKRPRALQFYHPEISGPSMTLEKQLSRRPSRAASTISNESSTDGQKEDRSENAIKQFQRVDLFIDLIWVGIIANLSASFGEQAFGEDTSLSVGEATGEFCLLFIPIWRMWDYLREYISNFYKDDLVDRMFLIWILVLSVLYGVNAPFAFNPSGEGNSLKLLIGLYLVSRASFIGAYLLQCIYLPFLRRQFAFQVVASMVTGALWVVAIYVPYPAKYALLILANGLEQPIAFWMASPLGDKLVTGGWKRTIDVDRYVERHEGFFIIILGEGVFRLIEGSPSGIGINEHSGTVVSALLLYYFLHWIYFNNDQTKSFIHAVRRTWWKPFLWKCVQILMFAALLILAASTVFLVKNNTITTTLESNSTSSESNYERTATHNAIWTGSVSLAITFLCMTACALLHRSLDEPGTLMIHPRWLRLAPRVPAVAVILCLPLMHLSGGTWCGLATLVIYVVFLWEQFAGLENDWKWFQPKEEG